MQGGNFTPLLLLSPGVNPISTAQGPGANGGSELALGTEGNSGMPGSMFVNASIMGQQNRSKIYYVDGIVNTSVRAGTYVALPDHRFAAGVQGRIAERQGGVRRRHRRRGEHDVEVRQQPLRRVGVRRVPQREVRGAQSLPRCARRRAAARFDRASSAVNLGGPLLRNKTFFFGSYDGWRYRDRPDTRLTVPAGRELDGDFSQTFHRRTIYNPYTTRTENGRLVRDPFPGNIIPANLISPSMQSFLKAYMPKPTLPGNVADNFRQFRDQESNSNAFQIRADHHFSARDNLFFRWTERRINNWIPVGDLGFRTPDAINRNYGGGLFHVFGSNLVLEVRGGVATQPTEDAPFEHELGLGPQAGLPQLDRFGGYIVAGLEYAVDQPAEPRRAGAARTAEPELECRRRPELGARQAQFQVRVPDAADLAPADQPVRADQLTAPKRRAIRRTRPTTGDPIASALLGLPSRIQGFVPD